MRFMVLLVAAAIYLLIPSASASESCAVCHPNIAENFTKSLHHTLKGIRSFDSAFACLTCHIENCTVCHTNHKHIPNMSKCMECHAILGSGYKRFDVHYKRGLMCIDCHSSEEIHGDGKEYTFSAQAVKVRCEDCHMKPTVVKGMEVPQYDPTILAHRLHEKVVSCFACHASQHYTIQVNLGTGEIKPSAGEFRLVVYEGRLYPACEIVDGEKILRVAFPHTITKEGRDCSECHDRLDEVFYVGFDGRMIPPGSSLASPSLEILGFDITKMGTYLILGVIGGIFVHLVRRRITLGRWIG